MAWQPGRVGFVPALCPAESHEVLVYEHVVFDRPFPHVYPQHILSELWMIRLLTDRRGRGWVGDVPQATLAIELGNQFCTGAF